jgi:hypothetical protein
MVWLFTEKETAILYALMQTITQNLGYLSQECRRTSIVDVG